MASVEVQEMNTPPTPPEPLPVPATAAEMLNEVDKAIYAILIGGQEYKIGSKRLTRADIKQLYKMKNDLMGQVASENSTSLLDDAYVAVFDGR